MTSAREDFDTTMELLADMLEDKLEDMEFSNDFEPWTFIRETMPPLADRLEQETLEAVRKEFMERDPNNTSRMRNYFDR